MSHILLDGHLEQALVQMQGTRLQSTVGVQPANRRIGRVIVLLLPNPEDPDQSEIPAREAPARTIQFFRRYNPWSSDIFFEAHTCTFAVT